MREEPEAEEEKKERREIEVRSGCNMLRDELEAEEEKKGD